MQRAKSYPIPRLHHSESTRLTLHRIHHPLPRRVTSTDTCCVALRNWLRLWHSVHRRAGTRGRGTIQTSGLWSRLTASRSTSSTEYRRLLRSFSVRLTPQPLRNVPQRAPHDDPFHLADPRPCHRSRETRVVQELIPALVRHGEERDELLETSDAGVEEHGGQRCEGRRQGGEKGGERFKKG